MNVYNISSHTHGKQVIKKPPNTNFTPSIELRGKIGVSISETSMNSPRDIGPNFVFSDSSKYLEIVNGFLKIDSERCHKRLRFKPSTIEEAVKPEKKTKITYIPATMKNAPSVQFILDFNLETEISCISNRLNSQLCIRRIRQKRRCPDEPNISSNRHKMNYDLKVYSRTPCTRKRSKNKIETWAQNKVEFEKIISQQRKNFLLLNNLEYYNNERFGYLKPNRIYINNFSELGVTTQLLCN